jgi:hypothetical protein
MESVPEQARSRRSLLTAAAGGLAAAVASLLGRPLETRAANGENVVIGGTRTGTAITQIDTSGSTAAAFWGLAGTASGVIATSESGYGLEAGSVSGHGVHAVSTSSVAVYAVSSSGTGVHGVGSGATGTGVYGQCDDGYGIGGYSASGGGARGVTDTGIGMEAIATSGTGAGGYSGSGIGVEAQSNTGLALKVTGRARFNRSGRRTAAAGATYLDVPVSGGVTTGSMCFASLATYRAGVYVAAVRPAYPTTTRIRVYFSKAMPAATTVSWFVLD